MHKKNWIKKNHSSLEINSPKVGGSGKKWSKTLPKCSTSIGFALKSEKLMNFTNFLIFNGNPMEVEYRCRLLVQNLAPLMASSELISWLRCSEWSDVWFLESHMSSNHQKKLSGASCDLLWCRKKYFSKTWRKLPKAPRHLSLPGEREIHHAR